MRWHRMAKVDTATGKILAQVDFRAETLPEAFAQMREYVGAVNSNELRFFGYVEALGEPVFIACECEHAKHFASNVMPGSITDFDFIRVYRSRASSGAHDYGASFLVLHSVKTVNGTYHVCRSCMTCVAPYLTSEPA